MFDEMHSGPSGTFEFGGGHFEIQIVTRPSFNLKTMWIYGLHWPRCCECEGTHAPISFGEGRFGNQFHVAHLDFWRGTGLDVCEVEAEFNRWLSAGDLPDWVHQATA